MAVDPARDHPEPLAGGDAPTPADVPTRPGLTEAAGQAPQPGGRVRAFAYLDTENTHRYRQLMGVLLANKRRFGLRLAPAELASRLWERFSARYDSLDALERDLDALAAWGAVDSIQDSSRASSTREFKRKRFTYDITAAGEIAERAGLHVDRLSERIGALERSQLPELLDALITLAIEAERGDPRPAKLVALFNDVAAKLERIRSDTGDFMRELGLVMADEQAVDLEPFERYKRRVIDHLTGFRAELRRLDPQFSAAISRVEVVGLSRVVAIAAQSDEPPVWGLSDEEVAARRAERLTEEWNGVRRWFRGGRGEAPPWHELDRALGDAIEWIIASAQRLIDRGTRRVDRAAEYRALALLFETADRLEDCHALYATAFGLYQPRHFSVTEADPELTPPTASWWQGAPALVEATLYRPGSRPPGAGRVSELPDHSMARLALAARRERERRELRRAQRRFADAGPLRLDQLGQLDTLEFRHLLRWLGRALSAAADADGIRRAESQDGLVRLELRSPPAELRSPPAELRSPPAELRSPPATREFVEIATPDGTLAAPNYEIEVIAC